jgi:hypothetical protein
MINENAPGQGLGGSVARRNVIQGRRDEQREAVGSTEGDAGRMGLLSNRLTLVLPDKKRPLRYPRIQWSGTPQRGQSNLGATRLGCRN